MKIFESHAHYEDKAFDEDRETLLNSLAQAGIEAVVNVGSSIKNTKKTIALMEQYPFIYGAVGVHPCDTGELTEADLLWLKEQCSLEKAVAVGEIGLDYYWDTPDRATQKYWFEAQLELAREVNLPVIIHSREAAADTLDIMKAHKAEEIGGVIHCFSYGVEMAREYLQMGFYIGVGGVVTYKNGRKLKEVVDYVPLDRIVIETDCPYLSPVPYRGKRNSSLHLPYVVEEIAAIKGIAPEEVAGITWENAKMLYGFK